MNYYWPILNMSKEELLIHLNGEYKPDERINALLDRLSLYYTDTPDSMDNREAMRHWKAFLQWADRRGYTRKEINQAKKVCNGYRFKD